MITRGDKCKSSSTLTQSNYVFQNNDITKVIILIQPYVTLRKVLRYQVKYDCKDSIISQVKRDFISLTLFAAGCIQSHGDLSNGITNTFRIPIVFL